MGMQEFTDCAEQRESEYVQLIEFVGEQLGDAAEDVWLEFKEWYDSLDDSAKWALDRAAAIGGSVAAALIVKGLAAVSAGAAEIAAAIVEGIGLGVLLDLLRECGMQLA